MKGIIMSGDSVPGVLAGTKGQTRRLGGLGAVNEEPGRWVRKWGPMADGAWRFCDHPTQADKGQIVRCKPRYQPGETVYIKETWTMHENDKGVEYPQYAANVPDSELYGPWRSPLFMPQWASRANIHIPVVRCERLHDISEADARAEGCESVEHFAARWDEVNKRHPWAGNFWVWVYEFCKID